MKKILLVDYYGTCDTAGNAVGHSGKVLNEYKDLIQNRYEVSAALSPCLIGEIPKEHAGDFEKIYPLKYNIEADDLSSLWKRIKDKFKLFYNLHQVFKIDNYDMMWFYRTDFFLALYMYLFIPQKRKKGPKIMVLIYQNAFGESTLGRILNYVYYAGFRKADAVISTQKGFRKLNIPILYIPDYYYDECKYKKYRGTEKKNKTVCVGTMSPYKQLLSLVEAFNINGLPLEIRGFFFDKDQYRQLVQIKKSNVFIEDTILTEDEYYQAIAGAKYAVLPYDMEQYQSRTSGVLIECLFLDTIAIAPQQLLQENQIGGMAYEKLEDLADISFFKNDFMPCYGDRKKEFDKKEIEKKLWKFIEEILNEAI